MINSNDNCLTVQRHVRNVRKIPFAALKNREENLDCVGVARKYLHDKNLVSTSSKIAK